jgi:hypothetical protein
MTAREHFDNLNAYIKKYPAPLPFDVADPELFKRDAQSLVAAIDYVIALFSKIGLGENFAPTMDGIILDACLEFLAEMKEQYHS